MLSLLALLLAGLAIAAGFWATWQGGQRSALRHRDVLIDAIVRLCGGDSSIRSHFVNDPQVLEQMAYKVNKVADRIEMQQMDRTQADAKMQTLLNDLGERVKELSVLYGTSNLLQEENRSVPDLLRAAASLFSTAWQYPDLAMVRITFDGGVVTTPQFRVTPWRQAVEFATINGRPGAIEVFYIDEMPEASEGPFLEEERKLINSLAEILRTFLERRGAEEALNQTVKRLHLLVQLSQTIRSTLDLSALLEQLIHHLMKIVPAADIGMICLWDVRSQQLIPEASVGLKQDYFAQIRLSPDEGLCGQVFKSGRSRVVHGVNVASKGLREKNAGLLTQALDGLELQSQMAVALRASDGKDIGTLLLGSSREGLTEADLSLLEGVAAQTSMAIQNAQLFEEVLDGQEKLRALSHRLVEVQESERRWIAHELHDEVGQALTLTKLQIQAMGRVPGADVLQVDLKACIKVVEDALQHVRNISMDLRPSLLDDLGLGPAIRQHVYRCAQEGAFTARVVNDLPEISLPPAVETTCFRIVQEAMTNIIRHAEASNVQVVLQQQDNELELIIEDNGVGFDVEAALKLASGGDSLGLLGMQERISLVQGYLNIWSEPGEGTRIKVRVPLYPPLTDRIQEEEQ